MSVLVKKALLLFFFFCPTPVLLSSLSIFIQSYNVTNDLEQKCD